MKEITIEEVESISAEIYEAALRVGCTHVRISGQIYPGGKVTGPAASAAHFVEYSWYLAAVVNGRAVFEETEPAAYAELLQRYGLGDSTETPEESSDATLPTPEAKLEAPVQKVTFTVEVLAATKDELERQARVREISLGELLDEKCAFELRYR